MLEDRDSNWLLKGRPQLYLADYTMPSASRFGPPQHMAVPTTQCTLVSTVVPLKA
jgi:hypothetical protein